MSLDDATRARLVGLFVDEAGEALGTLAAAHARLAAATAPDDLQAFGRTAHGLKGASAALGFARLAGALHALEEVSLGLAREEAGPARAARHARLGRALEAMERGVAHMAAAGLAAFPERSVVEMEGALGGLDHRAVPTHGAAPRPAEQSSSGPHLAAVEPGPLSRSALGGPSTGEGLRPSPPAAGPLPAATPIATPAAATTEATTEAKAFLHPRIPAAAHPERRREAPESRETPASEDRLSVPAAEVDDALRQAASLARAALQHQETLAAAGAASAVAAALAHRAERLEAAIASLRLLPAEAALSGVEDEVAALAQRLGREVVLSIEGREVRADRRTLQSARALLRHLVRNALDHGIEPPPARRAAGKPPAGRLALRLASEAAALRVTVEDDGAGFDVAAARQALARRGGDAARLADLPEAEVLARFAAEGGSTRGAVTDVSGRGLGLSAVAAMARDAGGALAIRTERGRGSAVTFTLPLEVYAVEVLVATAGGRTVGLPVQGLERTVLLSAAGDAVQAGPAGRTLAAGEGIVPLVALADALGAGEAAGPERFALVVHGPSGAVAVGVEEVGAVVAVVPAAVPGVAGRGALVSGLARLADGTPLQLLDPAALVEAARAAASRPARPRAAAPAVEAGPAPAAPVQGGAPRRLEVVLAEDSLSTREVLRVLLEAQGFRVRLAADGEEALARVRERAPDVLVSDVNMPRRDGLSLTRALRADPALARLPVVLLTSQDDDASRAAGASAGADAYLVKARFNAEVLAATLARIGLGVR